MKTLNLLLAGSLLAALVVISHALLGTTKTESPHATVGAQAVKASDASTFKAIYQPPKASAKAPHNA